VFVAAIVATAVGWFAFGSPVLGLLGCAIILGSTAEYWLGTAFVIDDQGASARTGFSLTGIEWANVKRLIRDTDGVRLSPLESAGTLDVFRGVYLRYGIENREEIERAIERFGGRLAPALGRGPDTGAGGGADPEGGLRDRASEAPDAGDPVP